MIAMTVRSQNGWSILGADDDQLRQWRIGPVIFTGRSGPPGFILAHYAQWHHEEIERLWPRDIPDHDDHWWGQRYIGNTNIPSNHWSGTAIDLNALRHPQGTEVLETFTVTQAQRIDTKVAKYGVLKWGGRFSTTPDSMHFELLKLEDAPVARVREVALSLVQTAVGRRVRQAQTQPVRWATW